MLEQKLGVNPYKFGMIGSTDAHTALAAVEEDNFFGKHSGVEPEPHRWEHVVIELPIPSCNVKGWQQAASGYAGVWATENTREAIFDAMKRKETYATTGSANDRALLRRLGVHRGGCAGHAYRPVPDMPRECLWAASCARRLAGKAPRFLVAAMKDPYSGNLDRIQIVKGWLDANGELREQVYNVVWSGDRKPGADGKLPLVGNTVDVRRRRGATASVRRSSSRAWNDPDFDPQERAFYYARVIEIPTPRWTAYEAVDSESTCPAKSR